jgi:putative N6-adenine-specific DNA methylase
MNEADIYRITRMLPWGKWFSPTLTIRVNVAAITCPLRSLDFITLKIKDAICDKFHECTNKRPSVDTATPDGPYARISRCAKIYFMSRHIGRCTD